MGKLTSQPVRMPSKVIDFLDGVKIKLGMKSRGQALLFIINVWGDIILAHLDNPLGAAQLTQSVGTLHHTRTQSVGTLHQHPYAECRLTARRSDVESAASNLQVKDPRMAKLEVAKSKLASK